MEAYRKKLSKRITFTIIYGAVVLTIAVVGVFGNFFQTEPFALGYMSGFCMGLLAVMIFLLVKYRRALQDDERLRKLYVQETDERNSFIEAKTGGMATNAIMFGLALASVVAGFIDQTVFETLLGSTIFAALVKGGLKIYYCRTM